MFVFVFFNPAGVKRRHPKDYDDYKINIEVNNFLKNASDREGGREARRNQSFSSQPTNPNQSHDQSSNEPTQDFEKEAEEY